MIVRAGMIGDGVAIARFWSLQVLETSVTFSSVPKAAGDVEAMIADRPCFIVAQIGDEVVGFVTYGPFREGAGYAHTAEHTIILAPKAQGQGAGRALMCAAMDHARAAQIRVLVAGVSGENTAAIAFHERLGFETVGIMPDVGRKFDRWMDLVLMQKRL